jgi:hypothetical protein
MATAAGARDAAGLSAAMDAPLALLRGSILPPGPPRLIGGPAGADDAPGGPAGATETGQGRLDLSPGLSLRVDPAARMAVAWDSPAGRILQLRITCLRPGDWLGLHLALPPLDLGPVAWLGIAARAAGDPAVLIRACLRTGLPAGGFHDTFFDRHLLAQSGAADHADLIAPAHRPDLPARAPWREAVLFLPPARSFALALHELRLFLL